jgi:hypothetical protein
MNGKITYQFTARLWRHSSPGGWYFLSLPQKISKEIRKNLQWMEEGWGRLKATAKIGRSEWETAIWFDTKRNTYLLPVKAEIRKKEKLKTKQEVTTTVWI